MQDFPSYLLRHYFHSTDWHPSSSYLNLTSHSSSILLDFPIPNGLALSLSSSPTSTFFSTHRLKALPSLGGCAGYVVARTETPLVFGRRGLSEVLERFRIIHIPRKYDPSATNGQWQASDARDYLLYGCIHAPTARLDALYTTRLSPAWNIIITACSFPPQSPFAPNMAALGSQDQQGLNTSPSSSQQVNPLASQGPTSAGATNLQFTLQHSAGKWFNEICYSLDDALWGFRTMHHFGPSSPSPVASIGGMTTQARSVDSPSEALLDTSVTEMAARTDSGSNSTPQHLPPDLRPSHVSTEVGGGLRGRFSAGAELFFSAAEKSAGLSTGVRFMTLPEGEDADAEGGGVYSGPAALGGPDDEASTQQWRPPSQPPTTITATLNPMMGHLSTAYASRMGRDIVACSRYDFNVYSYESDLTIGGEYWLRSGAGPHASTPTSCLPHSSPREDGERPIFWAAPSARHPTGSQISSEISNAGLREGVTLGSASLREDDRPANSQSIDSDTGLTSGSKLQGNEAIPELESTKQRHLTLPRPGADTSAASSSSSGISNSPIATASPSISPSPLGIPRSYTSPREAHPLADISAKASASPPPSALLKFSLSSSLLLSLLWQGRLNNCLVSIGIKADLAASTGSHRRGASVSVGRKVNGSLSGGSGVGSVVRTVGMEIVYWGGGEARLDGATNSQREPCESDGQSGTGIRISTGLIPKGQVDVDVGPFSPDGVD